MTNNKKDKEDGTAKLKIMHISTYDSNGGAGRAAYRIHQAQVQCGLNSRMRVIKSGTDDDCVNAKSVPIIKRITLKIHEHWLSHIQKRWSTNNPVWHDFGQLGAGLVDELNACDAGVLNLHFISEMLSVKDIGRLKKPFVWTLHDMWAFCGGEHYAPDHSTARFIQGYLNDNRPKDESGPDLNRKTWKMKCRAWARQNFTIICPSQWLADCAKQSVLFRDANIYVVPNPLNTDTIWLPIPQDAARVALNLPPKKKLILMGADGGLVNPIKGGDLLHDAIIYFVARQSHDVELMIFGQGKPKGENTWPCPVHWMGEIRDDRLLALTYSAADLMVVPSRQEAFGQVALEAQACGTPVVAFDIGGLPDILAHCKTGWLAKAYNTEELAEGISWVLADHNRLSSLSRAARKRAVELFSPNVVSQQYAQIYEQILKA